MTRATTMDEGTTAGPFERGRSTESRPKEKNSDGNEGEPPQAVGGAKKGSPQRKSTTTDGTKKKRRSKTSKSPLRNKSNSPGSPRTRSRSLGDKNKEKTEYTAKKVKDLNGEAGRAVKQEIIDNPDKVQTILSFPLKNENQAYKPSSALNPWVIDDDEDEKTQDTNTSRETNLSSSSRGTPKRKQKEMTKGITKEPDGVAKRTAFNRGIYRRQEDTMSGGRGRGRGRGRGGGTTLGFGKPARAQQDVEMVTEPNTIRMKKTGGGYKPILGEVPIAALTLDSPEHRKANEDVIEDEIEEDDTPKKKGGNQQPIELSDDDQPMEISQGADKTPRSIPRVTNPYKKTGAAAPVTYAGVTRSPQKKN